MSYSKTILLSFNSSVTFKVEAYTSIAEVSYSCNGRLVYEDIIVLEKAMKCFSIISGVKSFRFNPICLEFIVPLLVGDYVKDLDSGMVTIN
jgi:hypothetical protein